MNDEQFLCEYMDNKAIVEVNGIQLQELLRAKKVLARELVEARKTINKLRDTNDLLRASIIAEELVQPLRVDIRV